ncbi:MAG TPA: GDSL-type esterase/lipase family protein [Phototrophicaceae bacterium]|nr:GDSL-type esterase/lipase family protein [Phototrophicaceae bacterium]
MKIAFYGDSLTEGIPGASYFKLLRAQLPEHCLLNYGKINATVSTLSRQIQHYHQIEPTDISFLWIGVNDILIRRSRLFSTVRRYWAKDQAEFCRHYQVLLDILSPQTQRLIAAPPLLIGEDVHNPWNETLAEYATIICDLTSNIPNAEFLDLRAVFLAELKNRIPSPFICGPAFQSVLDALVLRTPAQIDAASAQRGLHLTLEGVHLNTTGAQLVADIFRKALDSSQ